MRDRREAAELLSPRFAERATELGLPPDAEIAYEPRSAASSAQELEEELRQSIPADLERGYTVHGPHRDDLAVKLLSRNVRRFGSQGQQRLALLALLLAERDVLARVRGELPVLLLDDVLSELDGDRRGHLLELLREGGQTLITTADPAALVDEPATRMSVTEGTVVAIGSEAPV